MLELIKRVYRRLTAGGSTEEQAIQSGIWATGINLGDRALQLLKIAILARLLSPKAFGLLGIALLVLSALRRFSTLGFDEALVQHENENVDSYLSTAWIMKIVRGVAIALVAFSAAPYLADFFNEPRSEFLIKTIAAANILLAMQNPAIVYFRKNLDFHKEFMYKMSARLADIIVAVGVAFIYRSVWALAAGIIASNFVQFSLSYVILNYRPKLEFNISHAKEMFEFGKWMFAEAVLIFLYLEGDDAFIGWFFTVTTLGFYQIAYRYSNAPATEVTEIIGRVAFPAYSKLQDDISKLREGVYKTVKFSTIISFPMSAGIIVIAPQFVPVVLGEQWLEAIPMMQLLGLWGGLRAFGSNFGSVFKAVGRPDYSTKLMMVRVSIVAVSIYPAARFFGVLGVISVIIIQDLIMQPVSLHLVLSIIEGSASRLINIVIYPLAGSLLMLSVLMTANHYLLDKATLINLLLLILSGVIIYAVAMFCFEKRTNYDLEGVIQTISDSIQ